MHSPWLITIVAIAGSVIYCGIFVVCLRGLFSRLTEPLVMVPHDKQRADVTDTLRGIGRKWIAYISAIVIMGMTCGSFTYFIATFRMIGSDSFTAAAVASLVEHNRDTIAVTLLAGVVLGIFIVTLARFVAISFSSLVTDYLLFHTITFVGLACLTFPFIIFRIGPSYYDFFTDHFMSFLSARFALIVLVSSLLLVVLAEGAVWLISWVRFKKGIPFPNSYYWINRLVHQHEIGELAFSRPILLRSYIRAFRDTIWDEINGEVQGFHSLYATMVTVHDEFFRDARREIEACIAWKSYGIPRECFTWYRKLCDDTLWVARKQELATLRDVHQTRDLLVRDMKDKMNQRTGEVLADKRVEEILCFDIRRKAEEAIRHGARIITTRDQVEHFRGPLDFPAEFTSQERLGNQRYMIINRRTVILSTPVPYRKDDDTEYSSNLCVVLKDIPAVTRRYLCNFRVMWGDSCLARGTGVPARNRRKCVRFPATLRVAYRIVFADNGEAGQARSGNTRDASIAGIFLETAADLSNQQLCALQSRDARFRIEINLNDGLPPIQADATLAWEEPRAEANPEGFAGGLRMGLPEDDRERLLTRLVSGRLQ